MFDKLRVSTYHASSWSARILLLAMAGGCPWWYGAANYRAQEMLLWAGIALAILTWLATLSAPNRTGRCLPLTWIMLAFLVVVLFQLIPLPDLAAQFFSGANRFTAWTQDLAKTQVEPGAVPTWLTPGQHRRVSIHPTLTQASLSIAAVAMVVCWSASTLLLSTRWTVALCVVLASSGLLNCFLGVLQLINAGHWTLLPMPPAGSNFATFVSRNSAPAFYASATGATLAILGMAFKAQKRKRRSEYRVTYPGTSIWGRLRNRMEDVFIDLNSLAVTCIFIVAFLLMATIATFSRGGALACVAASLITLCMTLGGRTGIARSTALASVIGGIILVALAFFELTGNVVARFDEFDRTMAEGGEGRLAVWGFTLSALPKYWMTGSGLGTFRFALLPFHVGPPITWFHHAESIPLEIALELGVVGIVIAACFCYVIAVQLKQQSATQRETLLLSAAMFASVAIGVQSLVDFSIILPGVFVPYLALIGTFMGRCRRMELEDQRQRSLGEAAFDARRRASNTSNAKLVQLQQRVKRLSHSAVASIALLCMIAGWHSLTGFAIAERLSYQFEDSRRVAINGVVNNESTLTALANEQQDLLEKVRFALRLSPGHPEVALRAGEVQLFLWRIHAATSRDWGQTSTELKWSQANPQSLSSLLRITDSERLSSPALAKAIQSLRQDETGQALAADALANFETAIAACPMDSRAVWGAINANCGWLDKPTQHRLLVMLQLLARNNPPIIGKAAIAAFQEGSRDEGVELSRTLVAILPNVLESSQFFDAVAMHLTIPQLRELMPRDLVSRARVLKKLMEMPGFPNATYGELIEETHSQLPEAEADSPEGWLELAWVAEQAHDQPLYLRLLQQGVMRARDNFALRMKLAQAHYDEGEREMAIQELESFLRLGPSAVEKEQCTQQLGKWRESLDQSQ